MTCGEKISSLRKANGMTQEDLGKVLNITYQAVSKWERGESLPDFNTMSQIAKIFKVSLSYFEEDGEIEQNQEQQQKQPQTATNPVINYIGTCVSCGRLLKEGEEHMINSQVVCKSCAANIIEKKRKESEEMERQQALKRESYRREQLGSGFDFKLGTSIVLAAVSYVLFTILVFMYDYNEISIYGFIMPFCTLAVFAIVHAISDFFNDLKDFGDEIEGYTRNLSLIIGAVFAGIHIILYLIFYLTFGNNIFYLIMLFAGAIISFTFISQYMWGSIVREIFTAGGITFKLPGFIFSLSVDSILWMIVTKILLGILAIIIFIVTTIFVAVVAMAGSVVTFIPCIISKTIKDRNA